jgi:hypothetical protein
VQSIQPCARKHSVPIAMRRDQQKKPASGTIPEAGSYRYLTLSLRLCRYRLRVSQS